MNNEINFSNMSGYEFEDYISELFRSMGFHVTHTSYSHDGGIDLLAVYEKPIFSGKYIIQCKNYSGLVGQPEIRDLYGVVMSENANKGIIITPSDYTDQAYSFSNGKNIELINGAILQKLIQTYHHAPSSSCSYNIPGFNQEQYDYLLQCIDNDPTAPKFYLQTIEFLRNHIIADAAFIKDAQIFDRIIALNQQLIKRCYKSKTDNYFRAACWHRIAEIEILRGNLGAATNILLDNDWFYIKNWLPSWKTTVLSRDIHAPKHFEPYSNCVLAKNLYSAFEQIGFDAASSEIIKLIDIETELQKVHKKPTYLYALPEERNVLDDILDSSVLEFNALCTGTNYDQFIFATPIPEKKKLSYECSRKNIVIPTSHARKHYEKSDSTIIDEIYTAFNQHGIILNS